jgi:hypothetical protein
VKQNQEIQMSPRIKSIQQLRRELLVKEKELDRLLVQREKLAAKLKGIDKKIVVMGGEVPHGKRGPGRPRKLRKSAKKTPHARKALMRIRRRPGRATGKPLLEYLREILGKAPKGLRARDIALAVRDAGYKTYSKDFYGIVAAALRDKNNFKRLSRGIYTLAK